VYGLGAGSVLILDDIEKEARPIREALARRGIGAIHVSDETQPESALKGIRVAMLDIHLGGLESEPDESIKATRGLIDRIIHKENGPYVAVIWTAKPDDVERFKQELGNARCPPVKTVTLKKSQVIGADGADVQEILDTIDGAIAGIPALQAASLWEEIIREAANDTLVSLGLADEQAVDRLAALLKAEADRGALGDDAAGMRSLLAALNPVHFDRAEERSAGVGDEASAVRPIRERAKAKKSGLPLEQRVQLNTALLFDPRANGFGAGRLYGYGDIEGLGIGAALAAEDGIRRDTAESEYLDSPERKEDIPVFFLEVSAACDHQQGKLRAARLIAGVAFRAETFGEGDRGRRSRRYKVRDGAHLRTLPAVRVPGFPDDGARIVWNAHYPVAVSLNDASAPDGIMGIKPIGRFREPLLADVRAWLGHHAGRPGYVSIG